MTRAELTARIHEAEATGAIEAAPTGRPSHVVAIGASAGGLEAISALVARIDNGIDAAFVVAQHLSPSHRSLMTPLIKRLTSLRVVEVETDMPLEAGTIFIVPENHDVLVNDRQLTLLSPINDRGPRPSVNRLFESLARHWGEKAIGVLLSGTGSDGADGACVIDDAGGLVIAQDNASAKHWSMPKAAIDRGVVVAVEPPEAMAQIIAEAIRGERPRAPGAVPIDTEAVSLISQSVEKHVGMGLGSYKLPTLRRRIAARMTATRSASIEAYRQLVESEPAEARRMADAMLIPVTSFFRDRDAFAEMRTHLAERLEACALEQRSFRAWTPGCCTGEEAYSLAMMIDEIVLERHLQVPVQIFATDISSTSVDFARKGVYPAERLADLPPRTRERYFVASHHGARVLDRVRDKVVFAAHDILRSTPFLHIDVVFCRNLLIYFTPDAQRAALSTIAAALDAGGLLFLGRSETVSDASDFFEPLVAKHRLFRRSDRQALAGQGHLIVAPRGEISRRSARPTGTALSERDRVEQFLLRQGPATVLINKDNVILQSAGDTGALFRVPPGAFPRDVVALVPEEMRADLRSILLNVRRSKTSKSSRSIRCADPVGGKAHLWRFRVEPMNPPSASGEVFVLFDHLGNPQSRTENSAAKDGVIRDLTDATEDLQQELAETRHHLSTVIEELELSNEELQATNEELMSSNEEFQATNEELETTNEELQATNEELETVNDELTRKNREIGDLNAELSGVLRSIRSPLLVFSETMRIRSINPAAETLFRSLGASVNPGSLHDVGLFLGDTSLINAIIEFQKFGREPSLRLRVCDRDFEVSIGQHEDHREGERLIIVLLHDLTDLLAVQRDLDAQRQALSELEARHRATLDGLDAHVALVDTTGTIINVNQAWRDFATRNGLAGDAFGVGHSYLAVCDAACGEGTEEALAVSTNMRRILSGEIASWSITYPCHSPWEQRWYCCTIHEATRDGHRLAVVMHIDVTREVLVRHELARAQRNAEELARSKTRFLANMSHELRTPLTAISGFAELMEHEMFGPLGQARYVDYVTNIKKSSNHLVSIISEIIEYAQVEKKQELHDAEIIDVGGEVDFVVELIRASTPHKSITFAKNFADGLPPFRGDCRMIRQVLINLMTNSAKFLDDGGTITVSARPDPLGDGFELRIEDDGPGVDEELLERIFEAFEQGRRQVNQSPNAGLGLGLAIVRSIVALHHGTIHAENRVPHGLAVVMNFPG